MKQSQKDILGFLLGVPASRFTKPTLTDALALCAAIKVPGTALKNPSVVPSSSRDTPTPEDICPTPEEPPAVPSTAQETPALPATTLPRRSQRLLGRAAPVIELPPPGTRKQTVNRPESLGPKKGPSRVRKAPCAGCKGKEKADPGIRIRLGMKTKVRSIGSDGVAHVHMGFNFLGDDQESAEGQTTLLVTLGTDIAASELLGLDQMELDVRLGFAEE